MITLRWTSTGYPCRGGSRPQDSNITAPPVSLWSLFERIESSILGMWPWSRNLEGQIELELSHPMVTPTKRVQKFLLLVIPVSCHPFPGLNFSSPPFYSLIFFGGGCYTGSSLLYVGFLWLQCIVFLLWWLLLWQSMCSRCSDSVFVAHGFSCPVANRIFPGQGLNLCGLHCKADS